MVLAKIGTANLRRNLNSVVRSYGGGGGGGLNIQYRKLAVVD